MKNIEYDSEQENFGAYGNWSWKLYPGWIEWAEQFEFQMEMTSICYDDCIIENEWRKFQVENMEFEEKREFSEWEKWKHSRHQYLEYADVAKVRIVKKWRRRISKPCKE